MGPLAACIILPQEFTESDLTQQNAEADFVFGNTARSLMQRTQRRGNDTTDSLPDLEIAIKPTAGHNNVGLRCKDDLSAAAMMMMEKQFLDDKRRNSVDDQLKKSNSSEMKPSVAAQLRNPGTNFKKLISNTRTLFSNLRHLELIKLHVKIWEIV